MKTTCLIIFGLCVLTSLANTSDLDEYKEILPQIEERLKMKNQEYTAMIGNKTSAGIEYSLRAIRQKKESIERYEKLLKKEKIELEKEEAKQKVPGPRKIALAAKVEKYAAIMKFLENFYAIIESEDLLMAAEVNNEDFKPDEDLIDELNNELSKFKTYTYKPFKKFLAHSDFTILNAEKDNIEVQLKDAEAKRIKEQWKLDEIAKNKHSEDKEYKAQAEILNKADEEVYRNEGAYTDKVEEIKEVEDLPYDMSSGIRYATRNFEKLSKQYLNNLKSALFTEAFEISTKIKDEIEESEQKIKSLSREEYFRNRSYNNTCYEKSRAFEQLQYANIDESKSEQYKAYRKQVYEEALAAWEKEKEEYMLWESTIEQLKEKVENLQEDLSNQEENVTEMTKNLKLHFKNGDKLGENKDQILERCQRLLYNYYQSFDAYKIAYEKQKKVIRDFKDANYDSFELKTDISYLIRELEYKKDNIASVWDNNYYKGEEEKVLFAELNLLYQEIVYLEGAVTKVKAYIERHQENTGSKLLKYSLIPAAAAAIAGGVVFFFSGWKNEKVNENDKEKQLFNLK